MNMAASTSNKVFLSFRSADDINNFNRLLYLFRLTVKSHLDEELQKRDEISPALLRAIQSSNISIIIFSKNYASSSRCLDELVQILQCREINKQIVLPVFYEINPSQVRKQTGPYATAFSNFEEQFGDRMNKVHAWRAALKVATNLCGFDTQYTRMQSDLLKKIDHDLSEKINASEVNMYISIYPLGYDVCREYLSIFLQVGSDNVLVVGIAGEAKMGKTVIAKAIYDGTFRTFDGSSFLIGVGQKSKKPDGIVQLQVKLIFDLLGQMINITSVSRGVDVIKERLRHKKVLIVLDDVDDLPQLFALVGSREWFGLGSKIIITSRDLPLLRIFGVDQMFMAKGLPLPLDIQELLEPYQQSCRKVAGLKEYIQTFSYLTNEKVKYLEECLIKERRKGAIQVLLLIYTLK
ncbi:TIR domain, NB-ARC domain containing protein [Parasponia andersonii]|uniref:TIR domain, NB-ARC domain containing protein n=1 Tax=Parasponia andersonii TaxID=3476 RepID=A0A2P5D4E3_PARAD|nr:TIR domain, NB-ARC domain containing protein [Parasponia andersonii]